MNMHPASAVSIRHIVLILAAMSAPGLGFGQTWNAVGNGTWSTAANWSPATVPSTGGSAVLGDTAANRTVTYDSAASGSLGNLTITQASAATNTFDLQRSLNLANTLTLGATSGGTAQFNLGSTAAAGFTLTSLNGVTVSSGGSLLFSATTNTAGTGYTLGGVSGSTPITVSGGNLTVQATVGSFTSGTAVSSAGNLTMSSGAIVIDNATGAASRRLALNGQSITITGGSISGARSGAQIQFNNTSSTSNITFTPSSFTPGNLSFNFQSSQAQNFSTNQTITSTTDLRDMGVKTFTSTAPTSGIGYLQLWDSNSSTVGSAVTLRLGSNLTLNTGAAQPSLHTSAGAHSADASNRIDAAIDTNGFNLDLRAGAGNGTWTPNAVSIFNTGYTLSGNGSITANAFNFSTANVTTNVGAGTVLNAAGGNATATNLGTTGTIDPASVFRYSGSASAGNPATLTWARNIGQIEVTSGVLRLTTTVNATADVSKIRVTSGGTLSISSEANLGTAPAAPVADYLTLDGGTLTNTSGVNTWNTNRGFVLGAGGGTMNVTTTFVVGVITGSGALTKTGTNYLWTANNTFSGGFNLNQGWIRPRAYSTVSGGVATSSPVGTGNLTINGGGLSGASGFSPTYFVNQTNVAADFTVNTGTIGVNQNKMVTFAGPINLLGAQRTVSLGSYTTAANSIATPYAGSVINGGLGGSGSLNFISADGLLNTVVTNGTLRFVRESIGGASDYVSLNFDAATFSAGAGLAIGSNVITTMSKANPFGSVAGDQPAVSVEFGGYFNMADANGARSPEIRTLAGTGVVTSLASTGASVLTINAQNGDNATFTGQIVDGSTLDATLGTTSAATVALIKSGAGTQTLGGVNAYSGDTTVNGGILALSAAGLNDASTVSIASGAALALNFSGSDTVAALFINGVQKQAGVYTSSNSSGAITGIGSLTVTTGPIVLDSIPPVITLTGSASVAVDWGSTYIDAGATATDNVDTSVTVNSSGTVNTAKPGVYTITYNASDVAGNPASPVTRTVTVSIANATTSGADGLSPLLRYALGANSPTDTVQTPVLSSTSTTLSLTAVVRTDDTALTVGAEAVNDLAGTWGTGGAITVINAADQTGVPAGSTRKVFTVDTTGAARKFLRLKATLAP